MSVTTSAKQIILNQGSEDAPPERFWVMIERYRGELVNQAFAILGNMSDAEEVVQESLCEAFLDHQKLVQARSFRAWLRTINRNNAQDRIRRRSRDKKRVSKRNQQWPTRMATTGGFTLMELRESLAQAIETLPAQMRAVVVLRYWQHHPFAQIARILDLPSSTVWNLYYEATLRLSKKFKDCLEIPAPPASSPQATPPLPSAIEDGEGGRT